MKYQRIMLKILLLTVFAFVFFPHAEVVAGTLQNRKPKIDTTTSYKYYIDGIAKLKSKDFTNAIVDFQKSIDSNPSNWKSFRGKGDAERRLGKYDEAISSYTIAISRKGNDPLSFRGRAEAFRFSEQAEKAIDDYSVALSLNANDGISFFGRGSCFYILGKNKEAINDFNASVKILPKVSSIFLLRGYSFLNNEQFREGVNDLNKCLALGGGDPEFYYRRGYGYTALADQNENEVYADSAIVDLKKYIDLTKDNAIAFRTLAMAYGARGDSSLARINFKKALELAPNNTENLSKFGNAELQWGNFRKACYLLDKAIKGIQYPSSAIYLKLGQARAMLKDTVGALQAFSNALKVDSLDRDVYETRLELLFSSRKHFSMVLNDIDHLTKLTKGALPKAETYFFRSFVESRESDSLSALRDIDKAIALARYEPMYFVTRALIRRNDRNSKGNVLGDLDQALNIDPTYAEAYYIKAAYLARQGEHKKACEILDIAQKHGKAATKEEKEFVCKGKVPKGGKIPEFNIQLIPRLSKIEESSD